MIIWCSVFIFWCATFFAHDHLQTHNANIIQKTKYSSFWAQSLRGLLPLLALALSFYKDPEKGILFWLGLGSCAGLSVGIALAYRKRRLG